MECSQTWRESVGTEVFLPYPEEANAPNAAERARFSVADNLLDGTVPSTISPSGLPQGVVRGPNSPTMHSGHTRSYHTPSDSQHSPNRAANVSTICGCRKATAVAHDEDLVAGPVQHRKGVS